MAPKPWSRRFVAAPLIFIICAALSWGVPLNVVAQASATKPKSAEKPKLRRASPRTYEDDEIRLRIPPDWTIPTGNHSAVGSSVAAGPSITQAKRKLLLQKNGYTLALAYDTEHASGVGRFIEMLTIPWLDIEDAWTCSLHMSSWAQPASRTLTFQNLILDTGLQEVREGCGISKDLGYWTDSGFAGERRWFAGFFTTADGGWFFLSAGEGCGKKTYILTTGATAPDQLPDYGDTELSSIIQQAIDIVNSIHYKRCPPTSKQ